MGRPKGLGFCTESQFVRLIFFLQNHALSPAFGRPVISGVTADIDSCANLSWPVNMAFRELLLQTWDRTADETSTDVQSDTHGGRHYYLESLIEAFPDIWIDRGPEGSALSRYWLCDRDRDRTMTLGLSTRADGGNGLVALASIVSKTVREVWIDVFNACWTGRVEGLRPTASYPVNAARFRHSIEPLARARGLDLHLWWRRK